MKAKKQISLNPKIWAIIPAAGSGRRFSAHSLKQYQIIGDRSVLEHSVARLAHLPLAGVVLAIGAADHIAKTLNYADVSMHFCLGGAERVDSVYNALLYLSQIASDQDWVLVHDAARPCVKPQCLDDLIKAALDQQQSAILAVPVRDTLKHVTGQTIDCTVDRQMLWQAQTPQIAQFGVLKVAIEQAMAAGVKITDEASALEFVEQPVQVVMGHAENLKITYPEDLSLASLILAQQAQ